MAIIMKTAILRRIGDGLKMGCVVQPEPGPGEVLIKVMACCVCHSDLHAIDDDWTRLLTLALIPGHEVTGHVAVLAEDVAVFGKCDHIGMHWKF